MSYDVELSGNDLAPEALRQPQYDAIPLTANSSTQTQSGVKTQTVHVEPRSSDGKPEVTGVAIDNTDTTRKAAEAATQNQQRLFPEGYNRRPTNMLGGLLNLVNGENNANHAVNRNNLTAGKGKGGNGINHGLEAQLGHGAGGLYSTPPAGVQATQQVDPKNAGQNSPFPRRKLPLAAYRSRTNLNAQLAYAPKPAYGRRVNHTHIPIDAQKVGAAPPPTAKNQFPVPAMYA